MPILYSNGPQSLALTSITKSNNNTATPILPNTISISI